MMKKKASERTFNYKLNFLILQSVVDRLDIYEHYRGKIKFFSPNVLNNTNVEFVRNEENLIEGTSLKWRDFRSKITDIKEGQRVYFINNITWGNQRYYAQERYCVYYNHESKYPPLPQDGIYTVFYNEQEDYHYIKALPNDDIYTSREEYRRTGEWSRKRKKRIGFKIENSDDFIISYDKLYDHELNILNVMMHERRNRYHNNYISDIPFMKQLYDIRKAEIDYDNHFIKLLQGRIEGLKAKKAQEAILWWKIKNKWKRDLKEDESKALRMITSYLLKKD